MDDPEETFGGDGDASPVPYEELVSMMAGGLYGELERLVSAHGPTAVSGLLPQVVSVLEALQEACGQVRDRDQALERLRDDRLRLLEQYERERAGRKRAEERFMELEDVVDQERKAHSTAVSQLEGQSRILENKARSYADQVAGLEEQKSSLLKEISILNQSHTKMVQSYKELRSQKTASTGPGQTSTSSPEDKRLKSPPIHVPPQFLSRPSDLKPPESPKEHGEKNELSHSEKTPQKIAERNVFPFAREMDIQPEKDVESTGCPLNTTLERNTVSLFAEVSGLSLDLLTDMDDGADLQGDTLETMIAENTQLQEARIALDTARRHLINRVEELSEERESLRMEKDRSLADLRSCQVQLKEAELELLRIQQKFKESRCSSEEREAEVGLARTQRFTRAEMARVVMERNLYKERLMELQETGFPGGTSDSNEEIIILENNGPLALLFPLTILFSLHPGSFDRLFSPSDAPESAVASPLPPGRSRPSRDSGQNTPRFMPRAISPSEADGSPQQKRRELYGEIRSHIWQEHGRAQIHGWSQPTSFQDPDSPAGTTDVPELVQLRMLEQKDPSTKLWCATASVGLEPQETSQIGNPHCSSSSSSQLWVAAGTHSASEVTLFNAPNTNQLLEHFVLPGIHVLSMACVPGQPVDEKPVAKPEILEDPLAPRSDSDEEAREMEAVGTGPTVWIGTQEGCIYIHSTVTDWRHCQGKARLKEAVHCIVHTQGRVVAALADGSLAIFHRNAEFSESTKTSPSAGIPLCAMEQAQISYHGHRDAVRFFVSVPGYVDPSAAENLKASHSQEKPSKPCSLVLSGGEGYINLRIGDNSDKHYGDLLHPNPRLRRAERSHLIVWQVQD
ncbi:hypothetical protein E2320_003203 [Naja naja]|nr:hypothetical protein E2320_003203 [Naja naja]